IGKRVAKKDAEMDTSLVLDCPAAASVHCTSRSMHGLGRAMWPVRVLLPVFLLLAWARPAGAQMIPAGDALEDYARLLQLSGIAPNFSFSVRPLSVDQLYGRLEPDARHPWQAGVERYRAPIGKR